MRKNPKKIVQDFFLFLLVDFNHDLNQNNPGCNNTGSPTFLVSFARALSLHPHPQCAFKCGSTSS